DAVRRAIGNRPDFEATIVPPGKPRTKPRALNYALALARGEYVVIYDAEDRPHPLQLRAAFNRFEASGRDLACVQAPLLADNAQPNWLSSMFALEYVSLFDGFLPALAAWKLPIMLGGTSNHFKASVLRSMGAWDPHNVTEDADLGIRLNRFGYRADVIDHPTFEEAPSDFLVWLKQRTRWFKGWMQTTIVHMRAPARALRELGPIRFAAYHLISTTLLVSALGHPFFAALVLYDLIHGAFLGPAAGFLHLMVLNLFFAYVAYGFLSYRALSHRGWQARGWLILTIPAYWVLLALPAWRALIQLITKPHLWEKTPHGTEARGMVPWSRNPGAWQQ
ncbi:MAG: glycosyltransferase family 2 protein, partial [Pseudomonadota bacterium]